ETHHLALCAEKHEDITFGRNEIRIHHAKGTELYRSPSEETFFTFLAQHSYKTELALAQFHDLVQRFSHDFVGYHDLGYDETARQFELIDEPAQIQFSGQTFGGLCLGMYDVGNAHGSQHHFVQRVHRTADHAFHLHVHQDRGGHDVGTFIL